MTGARIEAKEVSVVGFQINARVPQRDAAAVMLRGIVDQAFADRARIVPNRAAGATVQRVSIICGADEQDAVDRQRRNLQPCRFRHVKYPLRAQLLYVLRSDLLQRAVSPAGIIAVIRSPVGSY